MFHALQLSSHYLASDEPNNQLAKISRWVAWVVEHGRAAAMPGAADALPSYLVQLGL